MSNLFGRHEGDHITAEQKLENLGMSSVRETVEWINNDIKSKFAFVSYFKNLRVTDPMCKRYVIVAALLTNFYKCLNGCQTSEYFHCKPPTLEEYIELLNAFDGI